MNPNLKAFTLVELLLAIVLTMILTALLMPAMSRTHCGGRRSNCLSNARQIGLAFKQYSVDNSDSFPSVSSNSSLTSSSVFLSLTNGNYLSVGRIYLCPQDEKRTCGTSSCFTSSNNSYACLVADSTGTKGLTEGESSDNPLILDRGLIGAPGYAINLTNATWSQTSPHKTYGGNIFYVGGHASFRRFFDTGSDGTNGFVVVP